MTDLAPIEEAWKIRTDRDANRYLRKVARTRANIARIEADAKAEIAEIKERRDELVRIAQGELDHDTAALIDYRRWLEDNDPGLPKTYNLMCGDLARRAGSESVVVDDEPAFLAWADGTGDYVRHKVEIDKDALKRAPLNRAADGTLFDGLGSGEVIPGVRIVRSDDSYTVNVPKPGLSIAGEP